MAAAEAKHVGDEDHPEEHNDELIKSFVQQALSNTSDELRQHLETGLHKSLQSPARVGFQKLLDCDDEPSTRMCITMLTFPEAHSDVPMLAKALRRATDSSWLIDNDSDVYNAIVQMMACIHISHCLKRWLEFGKHFVLNGGLEALVRLFDHPNLSLREQALEIFFKLTNDDIFPWFSFDDEDEKVDGDDNTARVKMASLATCDVTSKLLANKPGSSTFTGGSFIALQLFAFFASYLRLWTGRYIRLSRDILALLHEWQQRSDVEHEEAVLAAKLHEDFSRFGSAEDAAHAAAETQRRNLGDENESDEVDEERRDDITMSLRTVVDKTTVSDTTATGTGAQQSLKQDGNSAFWSGNASRAIELYSQALDQPVPYEELPYESARRSVLLSNRAAAYLHRAERGSLSADTAHAVDTCGQLEGLPSSEANSVYTNARAAELDCDEAMKLNQQNDKAQLRRARALMLQRRLQEAEEQADTLLRSCSRAAEEAAKALLRRVQSAKRNNHPTASSDKYAHADGANHLEHGSESHRSHASDELEELESLD